MTQSSRNQLDLQKEDKIDKVVKVRWPRGETLEHEDKIFFEKLPSTPVSSFAEQENGTLQKFRG